ncbi:MAG TPA: response regulator, partial [Novosphingobium sp.]
NNGATQAFSGYTGPRRTVLVVDDTTANRAVLVEALQKFGFTTAEAADGRAGVEQARILRPDLILMDILMPVMNGHDAIAAIRQIEALQDIPILALSASATQDVRQRSLDAGANGFLAKPINLSELLLAIGNHLQLSWLTEEVALVETPGLQVADTLVAPPMEEIDRLLTLARAGNMRAIRMHADHIAQLDTRYEPFSEKLKALANAFQSSAILRLAEEHAAKAQELES